MNYQVIFKKHEVVEVEASNVYEAKDLAWKIVEDDSFAWLALPDETIVQKLEDNDEN